MNYKTYFLFILLNFFESFDVCFNIENPLISHNPDEQEMRERMKQIANEKFSHKYHYFENLTDNASKKKLEEESFVLNSMDFPLVNIVKSQKRRKRDGGLTMAVLSGVIGVTAKAVSDLTSFHPTISEGGCSWFGTSPLCNHQSDPHECTWSGRWMGANTAYNAYCRYDNSVGRCGELNCAINHFDWKAKDRAEIGGEHCDQLHLFNLTGHATCGYVAWFDANDDMVNSWYKTSN